MGWLGSANNMKWVGWVVCEFDGLGWVDKNGPMSMSEFANGRYLTLPNLALPVT